MGFSHENYRTKIQILDKRRMGAKLPQVKQLNKQRLQFLFQRSVQNAHRVKANTNFKKVPAAMSFCIFSCDRLSYYIWSAKATLEQRNEPDHTTPAPLS